MKVNGRMTSSMVMVVKLGQMVHTMLVYTLTLRKKELVSISGLTVTFTRVTGIIIKYPLTMDIRKVASNGMMENNILVNGIII